MFNERVPDLEWAKEMSLGGVSFGDIYPRLNRDAQIEFREWWLREPKVPFVRVITVQPTSREMGYTGDSCPSCGSLKMIRSGACQTCQECYSSSGCG